MKKMILAIVLMSSAVMAQASLGLNDISVLIPLPQDMNEINHFISPADNELIPKSVYKLLPTLTVGIDQEKNYQHNLKVVAIRFDPCFMEGFTPLGCQAQIRLIWQPIYFKTNTRTGVDTPNTMDTALHTFYNLTTSEWSTLLSKLKSISSLDTKVPLQINPTLSQERFIGTYWTKLKSVVLKYSSKQNLVRTTVMISRNGFVWAFRGVELQKGQWVTMEIPTLKDPKGSGIPIINQAFFIEPASLADLSEFKGGVTLMESSNPTWAELLKDSKTFASTQTEDEINAALDMAYQLENPKQHNPATTDCVSCHIAQTVRIWGQANFPRFNFTNQYTNSQFNLTNTSVNPAHVDRVRGIGYFNDEPIISQRVINETAQILSQPL